MELVHRLGSWSLAFVLAAPLAADVLTVGPAGSGAEFPEIQAAITAAQADDVLLVQPGTYAPIVVERPLRILGAGAGVRIRAPASQPTVTVRGIEAGKELVLASLVVEPQEFFPHPPTLRLEDCAGTVVLAQVSVRGDPFEGASVGLEVTDCARVFLLGAHIVHAGELDAQDGALVVRASELLLANCEVQGADDPFFALSGAHGVQATDASVRVWRSVVAGGGAEGKNGIGGGMGGAGIHATRTRVELYGGPGSELRGGNGEELVFGEGLGGAGLELRDGSSALLQASIPITGGMDGFDLTQAPAVRADGTSSSTLDALVFPTLATSAPRASLGSTFTVSLAGNPGAYQCLFLSLRTGPNRAIRRVAGVGFLDPAGLFQLTNSFLPPTGRLDVAIAVPASTALLGATLFLQSAERIPSGSGRLSSPSRRFAMGNPALVTVTN